MSGKIRAPFRVIHVRGLAMMVLAVVILFAMTSVLPTSDRPAHAAESSRQTTVSAGFIHPGVFDSLDGLETSKAHVRAGDAPWITIYRQLASSAYATRGAPDFSQFAPAGAADPQNERCALDDPAGCVAYCGSYNVPDVGCTQERLDARAVYAQALMYWYTDKSVYAQRAIAILNAYAQHFKGNTGSNGPLMTAWMGETMLRGAEILRYTYVAAPGDTAFDVDAFSVMLRAATVPTLTTFDYAVANGNWKLSAADSLINTAVFLDDRALYNQAVGMWREEAPAYIYLSSDGGLPVAPAHTTGPYQTPTALRCLWLADKVSTCQTTPQTDPGVTFQNGQAQESCRDLGHTALGLGALINVAETAWIQGDDLYGEQQKRIMTGVLYAVQIAQTYGTSGWPSGFCGGATELDAGLSLGNLAADVVYNAYSVRKGVKFSTIPIPGYSRTYAGNDPLAAFIWTRRTEGDPVGDVSAWEGLTHHLAGVPLKVAGNTGPTDHESPGKSEQVTPRISPAGVLLGVAIPVAAVAIGAVLVVIGTRRRWR